MRILALDGALRRASVGVVVDHAVIAARQREGDRGQAGFLPAAAASVLAEAQLAPMQLDLIAVTVGPGSFTGIRAALSLAHGIGLGLDRPVVGVTVGEAMAEGLPYLGGRRLWVATDSRRGRVFLERGHEIEAARLDALPRPPYPVAVAGDAAIEVAARLAAGDCDVVLTDVRALCPRLVALAAIARWAGQRPPRPAQPLYVDPPAVSLPADGAPPTPHPAHD